VGFAFNPNGFVWVADNHTGVSTLYDGAGLKNSLIVRIPGAAGGNPTGSPTGIVFSGGSDFVVTQGAASGPAVFMFVTEEGTIAAWAPSVDLTNAIDRGQLCTGRHLQGLALAANGSGHLLYATDFHNNRIDVFDSTFKAVTLSGNSSDPQIPSTRDLKEVRSTESNAMTIEIISAQRTRRWR
jgi:uncharacterized protein (TIGR03118 family)